MLPATRSEIRKIFTTRLWWGMALGMALLAALVSLGFGALVGTDVASQDGQGNPFATMTPGTAQLVYNAGHFYQLTTLFPLALGVLLITSEYRHQTITATFLSTPRRWVVLASKVVAVVVIGVIFAVVHAGASVAGASAILLPKGEPLLLGNPDVQQSLGIGIVVAIVWALLGFGFGMLVRNQIAAVLTAVGVAFIAHIALNILFGIQGWTTAAKFLPGNLTSGMLITVDPTGAGDPSANPYFAHWWVSALVLTGYAAVLAILGAVLTSRRDVA